MLEDLGVGGLTLAYAGLFGASAFAKMARWEDTRDWIGQLLAGRSADFVVAVLVVAEVAIMVAILVWHPAGAGIGTAWLVGASAVLWGSRHQVAQCGCFGFRQTIGPLVYARNSLGAAAGVGVMLLPPHGWGFSEAVVATGALAVAAVVADGARRVHVA